MDAFYAAFIDRPLKPPFSLRSALAAYSRVIHLSLLAREKFFKKIAGERKMNARFRLHSGTPR
ncbi:MAG: hypothetical protein KF765_06860 [Parvibaculaceae bacterium]|nr:hypothetical protein [Parvibaculaceae bacterium]